MKKLLLLTTLVLAAVVSHAQQGAVTFANGPAGTEVRRASDGALINATVALYGSTSTGLANDSSLTQLGATVNTLAPGYFSGGTRNIGNPGDTVTLQIRAWTGGFATWDAASLAAQTDTSIILTRTRPMWTQIVGGGTNPTQPITGAGRFAGASLEPVPEPSSIALGLLGLGAIVLFRRRK
jgi:hypothetical protein